MEELGRTLLGLGLKAEQMHPGQAALRAAIVYVVTLAIIRLGKRRLMARFLDATPETGRLFTSVELPKRGAKPV